MCGISFFVGRRREETPEWIPRSLENRKCPFSSLNFASVEFSADEITSLIAEDLARDTVLSEDHKHKLASVGRLRELQELFNMYKNGQHKPENRGKLQTVQAEMANVLEAGKVEKPELVAGTQNGPEDAMRAVLARGPDYAQYSEFEIAENHFQLLSSVLSLRQPFTKQPYMETGWILQFNGELYNDECLHGNDTSFIMEQLSRELPVCKNRKNAVATVVQRLEGEFAYVLIDTTEHMAYFGKDAVGKRSLLYEFTGESLAISSVWPGTATNAIECKGNLIYMADLSTYAMHTHELNSHPQPSPALSRDFPKHTSVLTTLHQKLSESCAKRQNTIHPLHPHPMDASIGILFSGGLDCTVLAGLIGENLSKSGQKCRIDLLTVGFDNPRTGLSAASSPDRVLSEQSWYELARKFHGAGVNFRLVQIDVSYSEWLAHRQRVRSLIYPCATEMDLSIAIAFYFATRAQKCELLEISRDLEGVSWSQFRAEKRHFMKRTSEYRSQAKVLFSGLGADELFGGYSRHENIFHGLAEDVKEEEVIDRYQQLSQSLIHDIDVIYERNLGRDDRAISSWGKELRYPYLDEGFVKWVVEEVPSNMKVSFEWITQRTKKGEKRSMKFERKYILRRLAETLGLDMAAKEIKRAIQFGAKSAKMEVGQQNARGTDAL